MRRRIEKEINKINDDLANGIQDKYSISDEFINYKEEICLQGLINFKNYNHISYFEIILSRNYPWSQPKILIENFNYLNLLRVDVDLLKLLGYKKMYVLFKYVM